MFKCLSVCLAALTISHETVCLSVLQFYFRLRLNSIENIYPIILSHDQNKYQLLSSSFTSPVSSS